MGTHPCEGRLVVRATSGPAPSTIACNTIDSILEDREHQTFFTPLVRQSVETGGKSALRVRGEGRSSCKRELRLCSHGVALILFLTDGQ